MFNTYAYTFIDTVQSGKKQVVKALVKNEKVSTILNDFVDAQTKYTRSAFDAGFNVATQFGKLLTDTTFYQEIQKPFTDSANYLTPDWLKTGKAGK